MVTIKNKMATSAGQETESDGCCLLVRTSPEKSLYFLSTSDYLQHLISHGDCSSGAVLEPRGPPGSQLTATEIPSSSQSTSDGRGSSSPAAEGVGLHGAVLGGRPSTVKTLIARSSPTLDSTDEQGFTPLLYAVLTGAHEIAATLLKAGASPDVPHSPTGATPLSLACLGGHADLAKLLLRRRASLSSDLRGCCPLHSAAWGGSEKVVKILLSRQPSLVTGRDLTGRTALHFAAARGHMSVCRLLVKRGCQLSEVDTAGRTALHWAILSRQLPCVEQLLSLSSTLLNQPDSHGVAPAHYAAMTGQCSQLVALIDKGASMTVTDANGYSPLFWACACSRVDTARQLIQLTNRGILSSASEKGEESLSPEEGGRCLHVACGVGSLDVCQLLLQTLSSLAKASDERGRTALHAASLHGHTECLDEVLEAGASPNSATLGDHRTSLHVASERGHCEVVASLLAAGASHSCSTHPQGERPIHLAAQGGHTSVIIELLRRGCAPDVRRGNDGRTALLLAAQAGHMQSCRLLVERGANPTLSETTIQRRTALDLAMAGGHREVADYLISVGVPSGGGKFHRAALTIQAVWRLHRKRRRQRSRGEWSAAVIQRAVRRWRRRGLARRVRQARERARHRAAAIIQRSWREFMEDRRRYEASCARLRARLHQEHLAASLLLGELQAQSQSISLPPPTSPRAHPHSSHISPATPGYLLQASAHLPSLPKTRPRKPLTHSSRPKRPPPPHSAQPPHQPVGEREKEASSLPAISTQPIVTSGRKSSWSESERRGKRTIHPQRKVVGGGNGESGTERGSDPQRRLPIISSEGEGVAPADGGPEETDQGMRVCEEPLLPPLPPTPSLVSPPPQPAPLNPEAPPALGEDERVPSPSPPQERAQELPPSVAQGETRESHSVPEREGGNVPQGTEGHRHYLRQTAFRDAILGQRHREGRGQGERGKEEEGGCEGGKDQVVDGRLLAPIQRYDRLNQVLGLLQRVQGTEREREGEEGVRLADLRQHIRSALDEAVRLRADTESLQHTAKVKLAHKPANSVH